MTDGDSRNLPSRQSSQLAGSDSQPIDSQLLFSKGREVLISHEDSLYRLRLTSNNKLILTK
ncbi:hemin uptake protein HemP [Aureimonas fodinaquatilis]|uniref:Hemin uptake protein HemP n=1 Tax=Aureimonas fodinaquatilis TaxID=2565783 RepID=A0A5B0DR51_9HYPH|nr:hemin uptake protein HemP [Aureimonas fodinaquatilis]KAA0968472.1 hemin uptake protein HemP [Aureimonas fodinaquatilis]